MKLLSIKVARAVWLFPTTDINPRGKYIYPLLPALIERYQFSNVPNLQEAIKKQQGIKLASGAYNLKKKGSIAVDLGIYNDGLVGDSRSSTADTEAFLQDCVNFATKEFGLQEPRSITRQLISEINFELSQPLSVLNPRLTPFLKKLSAKVSGTHDSSFELSGLLFNGFRNGSRNPSSFKFERLENTAVSENRFWSFAPVSTDDHFALIEEFIALLKK